MIDHTAQSHTAQSLPNGPLSHGAQSDRLVTVLVVESQSRWRNSLQHFFSVVPSLQDRFLLKSVTLEQARALAVHVRPLAIFWELGEWEPGGREPERVVKAISVVSRLPDSPQQFGCVPLECSWSTAEFLELAIAVRRLGVSAVLKNPEDLKPVVRMLGRLCRLGQT